MALASHTRANSSPNSIGGERVADTVYVCIDAHFGMNRNVSGLHGLDLYPMLCRVVLGTQQAKPVCCKRRSEAPNSCYEGNNDRLSARNLCGLKCVGFGHNRSL